MDRLELLFQRQRELMQGYSQIAAAKGNMEVGSLALDLDSPQAQDAIRACAWFMFEEIGEAMQHLKNKPWKQTLRPTDKSAYREEVVDALHFFLEFLILSGFTPESLVEEYLQKSDENLRRQARGY